MALTSQERSRRYRAKPGMPERKREARRQWGQKPSVRERLRDYGRRYGKRPEVKAKKRDQWRVDREKPGVLERKRENERKRRMKPGVREGYVEWRFKNFYGFSVDEYTALLAKQMGVCAICSKAETSRNAQGKVRPLSVDHDHITRRVRGLLCNRCNRFLGMIEDDITILRQTIHYLGR